MAEPWRNRIVGTGEEAPDQLLANPRNWRIHPKAQQNVLSQALDEVGWVTGVIVNRRSGCVVDGHLRVSLALSRGEAAIPVQYVDLDEREEGIVLASLDPISTMAGRDAGLWDALVTGLEVTGDALAEMLRGAPKGDEGAPDGDEGIEYQERYAVTVICADAEEQERVYGELTGRGYECRVVVV